MRTFSLSIAAASFIAASLIAATPAAMAEPVSSAPKAGSACHVVAGSNKGKSGSYSSDGSCSGSNWSTECQNVGTNQDGKDNGKCKPGKALTVRQPIVTRPLGSVVLNRAF